MSENESLPKGKDLKKAKELNEKDRFRLQHVYEDVDKAIKLYGMSMYDAERIRDHVSYAFNILVKYARILLDTDTEEDSYEN